MVWNATFTQDDHSNLVSPRWEDSGKDNNQWLAYEDACHLRRVWINIWHVSEALTGTRDTKMSVEGHFWPELELDPDDDREIMQKRSHDLREHEP